MPTRLEVAACAKRINRSVPTVWRWIRAGCRINDPQSIEAFQIEMERRKTNIARSRERRGITGDSSPAPQRRDPGTFKAQGKGQLLGPPGKRGAAHALARLELQEEEEAYRRLQVALANGDPFSVDAAQGYWLKVAEVLRRLDRELEISRRSEEEMIPLKTAQDTITFVSEWLRVSICVFLSAEGLTLAGGFKTVGELKPIFDTAKM
jgi:hypothetical protein